jgi:hypothetical protein
MAGRSISLASETSLSMIVFKFDQLDLEFLPVEDKIIEAAVAYCGNRSASPTNERRKTREIAELKIKPADHSFPALSFILQNNPSKLARYYLRDGG